MGKTQIFLVVAKLEVTGMAKVFLYLVSSTGAIFFYKVLNLYGFLLFLNSFPPNVPKVIVRN